jgi:glucan 1,3-beta-glucosidase
MIFIYLLTIAILRLLLIKLLYFKEEIMRRRVAVVIIIIGLALGLATVQAMAQSTVIGLNYGPYRLPGQAPGTDIPDAQFISDLQQIATKFGYIKTYGSDPVLAKIVPLIKANNIGLKVAVGIYESNADRSGTMTQINTAISLAQTYPDIVNMVVVGNECIQGSAPSAPSPIPLSTMIADLNTVKAALPSTTVTTCLTYQAGLDLSGPLNSLLPAVDNVMVNIYPFYGGVAIDGAVQNLVGGIQLFSGHGKPVWVGETGWPSAGNPIGAAIPNLDNEKTFTLATIDRLQNPLSGDPACAGVYLFEAYDELWKTDEPGGIGAHWGLWTSNGGAKVFSVSAPPGNAVPLPGTLLLLGSGLLGLVPFRAVLKG